MTDHDSATEATDPADPEAPPEIRSALVAGVSRHRRRTRVRALGVGVVVVVAGTAGLVGGVLSQNPSPALALAIEPAGSWIEVEIVDSEAGEQQMTAELQRAGIDAEVRLLPTIPQRVGAWMGLQRVGAQPRNPEPPKVAPAPAEIWNPDDIAAEGRVLMIRRSALGRLERARWVFYVGREPAQGETPQVLFDDGPREIGPRWRDHRGSVQD